MGKKLFVGNLSWNTTDDSLNEAFSQFGEITEAKVITDRDTGRSRGFGFVEMPTDAEAQAAIEGLNGKDLKGRTLNVNQARPRTDRRGGDRGRGGGRGRRRY